MKATSATELLKSSCRNEFEKSAGIIQSSFSPELLRDQHIDPSENGLVHSCWRAYSNHHHLALRPEDIWFAVLSQTGFYINAHAEELRHLFVAHEGQKELEVVEVGNLHSVDFGALAERMTREIQRNVLDPELRSWVMPDFTTTRDSDRVVASVLMMGALQEYFSYKMTLLCGIPSVTLLGEREDWVKIQGRILMLEKLGSEAVGFATLLRPVLRYFIETFDHPDSPAVKDFWSRIVHWQGGGSGPSYLSGWITAFCAWDAKGQPLFPLEAISLRQSQSQDQDDQVCELDGVYYNRVDTSDIPNGYAGVPVLIDDNGVEIKSRMVAGSVGILATSSGQPLDRPAWNSTVDEETGLDSLQPVSGWWMFKVTDDA
jgi:hypothetical protein